jgi:hypothetical protein
MPQPQSLFLDLRRRSDASPNPGVGLELCVKSHGRWEVVDDAEVILMPDKVIRCRFDLKHEVFAGGFMMSAGFGPTTEASSLKSPASGSNCGITPSAAGQDLSRGAIQDWLPSAAHQRGRDQAAEVGSRSGGQRGGDQSTESGRGPLAFGR